MKLEDILTLVKAGYTREEIAKLETPETPAGHTASPSETPETPKPAEAPVAPPAKAPEETSKPAAAPETPKPETSGNDQVLGAINALTAAIQKMNIQNASIPGGGEELTAEDMIANIINPPLKSKGGK